MSWKHTFQVFAEKTFPTFRLVVFSCPGRQRPRRPGRGGLLRWLSLAPLARLACIGSGTCYLAAPPPYTTLNQYSAPQNIKKPKKTMRIFTQKQYE